MTRLKAPNGVPSSGSVVTSGTAPGAASSLCPVVTVAAANGTALADARCGRDLALENDHLGLGVGNPQIDLGPFHPGIDVGRAHRERAPDLAQEIEPAPDQLDQPAARLRRCGEPADRVLVQPQRRVGADQADQCPAARAHHYQLASADRPLGSFAPRRPVTHTNRPDHRDEVSHRRHWAAGGVHTGVLG